MMMKNGLCSTSREAFFLTNLKAASVTIYPNGFLSLFSLRGGWLGRVLASSRLAMKKGCIFLVFRLAGCWLSGHCRLLAGGRSQDKPSTGGRLLG